MKKETMTMDQEGILEEERAEDGENDTKTVDQETGRWIRTEGDNRGINSKTVKNKDEDSGERDKGGAGRDEEDEDRKY
jgi:hypothetical protein